MTQDTFAIFTIKTAYLAEIIVGLAPEIMQMQIGDAEHPTTIGEALGQRLRMNREDPTVVAGLPGEEFPRTPEERDKLVARLGDSGMLAVAHQDDLSFLVKVGPQDSANLSPPES